LLRPHPRELAQLFLVPAACRRLMEHGVELSRVHLRHLLRDPLAAEPLGNVEDRHARDPTSPPAGAPATSAVSAGRTTVSARLATWSLFLEGFDGAVS